MSGFAQIGQQPAKTEVVCVASRSVLWLLGVTLAWMIVEAGLSLYAAVQAHSPALLAFGSDSLVELLSASVVLLQFGRRSLISQRTAGRVAAVLLFALAAIVAVTVALSLLFHLRPEASCTGMAVTVAALIVMPILAVLKRREARRTGDVALAADSVQSATCAYLALVTLTGLAVNAASHLPWFDSLAALLAIPLLIQEGRSAWKGHTCGCC
jgi:divalent metal cation (Fe/Co/Zn/Cd) transporter